MMGTSHARTFRYTEMEMFVPLNATFDIVAAFRSFQAKVRPQHKSTVALFTGVRYVAADDIWLSPQYRRDNAVVSFIVTGDKTRTGDPAEFAMFAQGLEALATTQVRTVGSRARHSPAYSSTYVAGPDDIST